MLCIILFISAAAEAAHLAVFDYNEFKDKKKRKSPVYLAAMKSALIRYDITCTLVIRIFLFQNSLKNLDPSS